MCGVVDSNHTSLNINCRSLCEVQGQVLRSGAAVNRDFGIASTLLLVALNC